MARPTAQRRALLALLAVYQHPKVAGCRPLATGELRDLYDDADEALGALRNKLASELEELR